MSKTGRNVCNFKEYVLLGGVYVTGMNECN